MKSTLCDSSVGSNWKRRVALLGVRRKDAARLASWPTAHCSSQVANRSCIRTTSHCKHCNASTETRHSLLQVRPIHVLFAAGDTEARGPALERCLHLSTSETVGHTIRSGGPRSEAAPPAPLPLAGAAAAPEAVAEAAGAEKAPASAVKDCAFGFRTPAALVPIQ